MVRGLVKALGGMRDATVGYVGTYGSDELWRVDVAEVIPRPALLVEGLQWRPTEDIPLNGGNAGGVLTSMRFVCLEFFPWEARTRVRPG